MKILIVGCGGIGGYIIRNIADYVRYGQISADLEFNIADDDIVECKNVKFQNFETDDVGENKAVCLAHRYRDYAWIEAIQKRIEKESQIKGYDLIICCADNMQVRKLIFEYCHKNSIEFIDLRAEGRFIMAFQKTDLQVDLETLDTEKETGSCQREYELKKGILQNGFRIVAEIGLQMLLNFLRKQKNNKILMRI
jgi:molybdopterin/thiamine biosynthesis adenylyltransferase